MIFAALSNSAIKKSFHLHFKLSSLGPQCSLKIPSFKGIYVPLPLTRKIAPAGYEAGKLKLNRVRSTKF